MSLTTALGLIFCVTLAAITVAIVIWPHQGTTAFTYAMPPLTVIALVWLARDKREEEERNRHHRRYR